MIIYWHNFAGGKGDGNANGHSVDTADSSHKAAKEIPLFTAEEETKFACRYEGGYDLNDPRYKAWLEIKQTRIMDDDEAVVSHMPLSDVTPGSIQPKDLAWTSDECLDTATFTVEQEV